jgi:hypothetical protein
MVRFTPNLCSGQTIVTLALTLVPGTPQMKVWLTLGAASVPTNRISTYSLSRQKKSKNTAQTIRPSDNTKLAAAHRPRSRRAHSMLRSLALSEWLKAEIDSCH